MSDKYIRQLERRVTSGDLSAVTELAEAYRRIAANQPPISPVVIEALNQTRDVLRKISNYAGDEETWNTGGDGFKAALMVDAAIALISGEPTERVAGIIETANQSPDTELSCESCGVEEFEAGEDRIHNSDYGILCDWCLADAEGAPYGRCSHCDGAKAVDRSCACRPR